MAQIRLSGKRGQGLVTIVDDDIYEQYGHLKWHLSDTGYVVRRSRHTTVRLHRLVAGTPKGVVTDHKNHDRLDNRATNLRIVSQAQNAANYKGERGYCWDAYKGKWMVRYRGKFYGRYSTKEEAADAYRRARSGVAHKSQSHPRRRYLPKGIQYMQSRAVQGSPPYYIRPTINGHRKFIGYFSNAQDAEVALTKILGKEAVTS